MTGAIAGTVGMTLFMANREPFRLGPLVGASIAVATAAAWVIWLLPPLRADASDSAERSTGAGKRVPLAPYVVAAVAVLAGGAGLGGYEALPLTILASLLCLVPAAAKRPGLAVMIAIAAIYLPSLGTTSLWDPWETHYAEVAREILARNDWISLWWAQDKWFWSKPVLLFWMEALSMGALGVDFMPDAHPAHPEWAVRLPAALMALAALGMVYVTVRRIFDRRAGVLATLVLATMPQFFFLARQAITDLPLVAGITIASCALLLSMQEDPQRKAPSCRIGPWRVTLQHVVVFALIVMVLPQATYLISRNLSWIDGFGLVAHPDRFLYGSAGNVDVPGNPNPRDQLPAVPGLLGQPFLQGLLWLAALATIVFHLRRERRAHALWMVVFYAFCAIAFLAKGLPGIAIPGAAALFYLVASRRWELLSSGRLHVSMGILVVSAVSLPWYLAMYVRHGAPFLNRLLIHDHINRLAAGVHGDTGTVQYFLTQLGYATFPWIGLFPLAAFLGFRMRDANGRFAQRETVLFLSMWLLTSFVLFSAMVTKYHHYLLPAIVPAAILVGVALARIWGPEHLGGTALGAGAGACLALGFAWLAGDPRGVVPASAMGVEDWVLRGARPFRAYATIALGVILAVLGRRKLARSETRLEPLRTSTAVAVALVLGAAVVAFVGRDLSWTTAARPQGNERLIDLFVYNYQRLWPRHLDYRAALTGFAVAASSMTVMASARRWRPIGLRGLAGVAFVFCAWSLNVYMTDLSRHWGQRDLVARYYAERQSPDEPLIAWQMNWKGENFYTGNRVHAFVETDNERIEKWLERNAGRRVYVVLEHKRLPRFEKLVDGAEIRALTTPRDNNKHLLVTLEIGSEKRLESKGL